MDFALSPELLALRDEALEVGRAAAKRAEVPEDTWITGHDRAFAEELGMRGWLGMTWPVEHGGQGLSNEHQAAWLMECAKAGVPPVLNMVGLVLAGGAILGWRALRVR